MTQLSNQAGGLSPSPFLMESNMTRTNDHYFVVALLGKQIEHEDYVQVGTIPPTAAGST